MPKPESQSSIPSGAPPGSPAETVRRGKLYFTLFYKTLYLSTFTVGGGFVIIPLMQKIFVEELGWLSEDEMLDLAAIAQSAPGAVAVNAALLVGRQIAGYPGMFISMIGTMLPPLVILSIITHAYELFSSLPWVRAMLTGMSAGVSAIIAQVVIQLTAPMIRKRDYLSLTVAVLAFVGNLFFEVNVLWIILGAALIGVLRLGYRKKKEAL